MTLSQSCPDRLSIGRKSMTNLDCIFKSRDKFTNKGQSYGFSSSHVWMWELDHSESWAPKNWCCWTAVLEKNGHSLGLQGDPTIPTSKRSVLGVHWKDWCWSRNSNTLTTWCEKLSHSKRPWCWERLRAGGDGNDRRWNGWIASLTQWIWVWVDSGIWWWTGRPGVLRLMGSQRVGRDWTTELNWWNFLILKNYEKNKYNLFFITMLSP